jgi:hypothetical protein
MTAEPDPSRLAALPRLTTHSAGTMAFNMLILAFCLLSVGVDARHLLQAPPPLSSSSSTSSDTTSTSTSKPTLIRYLPSFINLTHFFSARSAEGSMPTEELTSTELQSALMTARPYMVRTMAGPESNSSDSGSSSSSSSSSEAASAMEATSVLSAPTPTVAIPVLYRSAGEAEAAVQRGNARPMALAMQNAGAGMHAAAPAPAPMAHSGAARRMCEVAAALAPAIVVLL